jgi:2-haloacid dehalogenase
MAHKITTIVFDIGNVLFMWDMRNHYRKTFADPERMEWFLANVCTHDFNLEQDRGRPFAEAVAWLTQRHPEWAKEIAEYDTHWTGMVGEVLGTVDILSELQKAGWPTYAITNFSREKFDVARGMFPFLNSFRGVVVSGDEKLIKPDPAIFELFLDRYKLRADECIFIDDSKPNVESARKLGFHALHFTSPEQFRADLVNAGVL